MKLAIMKPVATSSEGAVKLVRQLRAAHFEREAPREYAALPHPSAALVSRVNEFLDRLAELPLAIWLATGRALSIDRAAIGVRQRASEALDVAIGSHGLGYAAWSMRDAVETVAFLKARELREWAPAERGYLAAAHGAAETATLAVLARDHLSEEDFRVLVAAFGQCISIE